MGRARDGDAVTDVQDEVDFVLGVIDTLMKREGWAELNTVLEVMHPDSWAPETLLCALVTTRPYRRKLPARAGLLERALHRIPEDCRRFI